MRSSMISSSHRPKICWTTATSSEIDAPAVPDVPKSYVAEPDEE